MLVANQVVGPGKVRALAEAARRGRLSVAVDDARNAADISAAACAAGSRVEVLIEVDVGMKRARVRSAEEAVSLARQVEKLGGLRPRGVQGGRVRSSIPSRYYRGESEGVPGVIPPDHGRAWTGRGPLTIPPWVANLGDRAPPGPRARVGTGHFRRGARDVFRIRRIYDDLTPANRSALEQVAAILRAQMAGLSAARIDKIPEILRDPLRHGFRAILYVAEGLKGDVEGFALLSHDARLRFCYLDYLASDKVVAGRGVGGALYRRVREEAELLDVRGIFYECLPDDPALCRDPEILKQNRSRLRFYEAYGARPIANTAYETPATPGGDNPPYLVLDGLGRDVVLEREYVRRVMAGILTRKYKDVCSPEYIRMVVESVRDDPVRLREPRYLPKAPLASMDAAANALGTIALVVTDQHEIHHVHDRGYVESPVRIQTIRTALEKTGLFVSVRPEHHEDSWLTQVHDPAYVGYLKRVCADLGPGRSVYPYVFPIRNQARPPVELAVRAGYYCIDTFTPLSYNAFLAARRAVDCALTAARELASGRRAAYALVRPPGHHAERRYFGGFCYFNNAAIAAHFLSRFGNVAILDIDYHHGNGQQTIFYERPDVLTVSIHGHPRFAYPYFSGFADERGAGEGAGYNANYPLPETVDPARYLSTLGSALTRIRSFSPSYLIVCLGLDTAKGDPTGTWSHRGRDFRGIGEAIGSLRLPTLVVQEGGYDNRSIGANAAQFFIGLSRGLCLSRADGIRGRATGETEPKLLPAPRKPPG